VRRGRERNAAQTSLSALAVAIPSPDYNVHDPQNHPVPHPHPNNISNPPSSPRKRGKEKEEKKERRQHTDEIRTMKI